MKKFGKVVVKLRIPILVLSFLLLIPSVLGYFNTRVNYDILYYLPSDIDTMQGQDILLDDFGKGAYAMVVVDGMNKSNVNTLSISVGSFSTYKEGTLCSSLYALNLNAGKLQQEGTAVLQSGLSQLTANNDTLKSGASQLADGTATLKDSSGTLADGVTQLNEGAITLKDGMAQFNSEAIEPITKLVDSDAQTAVDTIKAVVKAGQEYNSFLGKSDDKAGSVTFVYKTAGITANK